MSSSDSFTTLEIPTHFSTAATYLSRSPTTDERTLGSKTTGANSAHLTAQSYKTVDAGSTIVTSVPMCKTLGFKRSGSGSQKC
jgi:hypothetical protein